jgi:chromate transport protein ChrA
LTRSADKSHPIRDLVLYFLRLGTLGFGGPVALVGQMERELVRERGWLTKEEMREVIAVCQSLPGPLAIQVGIFISYLRGGFWGAWAGGWGFILPNFLIVAGLGALYVHFRVLRPVTAIFYGVSPVVIALVLHSCYRLAKLGMEDWLQWCIAGVCFLVTVVLQAGVALLFIVLRHAVASAAEGYGTPCSGSGRARRKPPCLKQALVVLSQSRRADIWKRLGDRAVLAARRGARTWMAWRARIFDRGCHRHDQPGACGHHRDLRGVLGRRLLGGSRRYDRYLSALLPPHSDCRTNSETSPRQ